jgi:hypothetical protein
VRAPGPWAASVGGPVLPVQDHAAITREAVKARARAGGARVDALVDEILCAALTAAYEAGTREGRSAAQSELRHVIQDRIRHAVASIQIEPARCPHCLGRGCEACKDSGNRLI